MHVWDSWSAFSTFLDQSNWGGAIISLGLPAAPLALWVRYHHRRAERHADRRHREILAALSGAAPVKQEADAPKG